MKWIMGGVYEFIFRFFGFLQSFVVFSYLENPQFSRENPTVMLSMQFDQKNKSFLIEIEIFLAKTIQS